MPAAGLLSIPQFVSGQLAHDRISVSHSSLHDILRPDVNIVHLKPRHLQLDQTLLQEQAQRASTQYRKQVLAKVRHPEHAALQLTQQLSIPEAREYLQKHVAELIQSYGQVLGRDVVNTKLEVLGHTVCPRYHADHVGARLLVSFTGAGTWYVENRYVRRKWDILDGVSAVASVQESFAVQAEAGEVVCLKGHAFPGNAGLGAVHKSPDVSVGDPLRILLTIDDDDVEQCQDGNCNCGS